MVARLLRVPALKLFAAPPRVRPLLCMSRVPPPAMEKSPLRVSPPEPTQ
jgi:hypothetical protein